MSEENLRAAAEIRDDPSIDRWIIAAYEEASPELEGVPTQVCFVQGPSTSSQGVEVVPLIELAAAYAVVARLRRRLEQLTHPGDNGDDY